MYRVLQCLQCCQALEIVPQTVVDHECPRCHLVFPAEAYRWVADGVAQDEARRLAEQWNPRLARGLTWTERLEFKRLA